MSIDQFIGIKYVRIGFKNELLSLITIIKIAFIITESFITYKFIHVYVKCPLTNQLFVSWPIITFNMKKLKLSSYKSIDHAFF